MSKRFGKALAALVETATALQKPWRRAHTRLRVAQHLTQRHTLSTRHGPLVLLIAYPAELHYAREFFIREPETLDWIDGFATPCRFWDVGANIGVYSLYAALRPGIEVAAFEPAAASYLALCRNIDANRSADKARAYCIAFADRSELGQLNLTDPGAGGSFNSFNTTLSCFGTPLAVAARQGAVGFSIDGFRRIFDLPAPNYLKIDVDSIEEAILAGAADTLRDLELRSILLELEERDSARNDRLIAALEAAGLHLARRSAGNRGGSINGIFTRAASAAGATAPAPAAAAPAVA